MAQEQNTPQGPDLTQGVALTDFVDGKLLGHVGDEEVLLVQSSGEIFAVGAHCTHYHGPLAEGLITGESVRCPWHHACFDLRTGEAERAPALSPLACWKVERRDGRSVVKEKREQPSPRGAKAKANAPRKIVIIGGGAAGFAAAEMLRRRDYRGSIVMLSDDDASPVDRPNLSKDYLAGSAPEDWLPLRPDDFYTENRIELRLKTKVAGIDPRQRKVTLGGGESLSYDRLLLATGAEPVRLPMQLAPITSARRRPGACPYLALARRLPRHYRRGEGRAPGARDRREFHRARSCGVAAHARRRSACGGAGSPADGACFRSSARRFRARAA